MVAIRPLFGSRASVENVKDSFGTTVELVKSSESQHGTPSTSDPPHLDARHSDEKPAPPVANALEHGQKQSLAGFLNGAALVSAKDDHSKPEDHHHDHDLSYDSEPSAPATSNDDDAVAWKHSAQQAESSDQHESARARSRFGRSLKRLDAKVRTTFHNNAPPTAADVRSPYSIGNDDHLATHNNRGAADLLNDASLETLQHLSDDDDDSDEDADVEDDDDHAAPHAAQSGSHPDPVKLDNNRQALDRIENNAEQLRTGSMKDAQVGDIVRIEAPVRFSDEEKLKAIIDEFGECPSLSHPNEPEKLIADITGVLVKTVLIKGNIFLTSRRICFLAYIPTTKAEQPDPFAAAADQVDHAAGADRARLNAPIDPNVRNPILKSGPAIIHRPGKLRPKRKVWIELRRHSFNAYRASNKLYKPLMSARLSNLLAVLPIDWSEPHVIRFVEGQKYSAIEFKTQEAALDWRKELEGAVFHSRNTADKVRISIPLERIVGLDTADFLQVAKIVHIDVLAGSVDEASAAAAVQEHRDRTARHQLDHSWSSGNMYINCPKNPGFKCHITQIALGFTVKRLPFIDLLQEALKSRKKMQGNVGFEQVLRLVPTPLLDLESDPDADDNTSDANESSESQKRSLAEKFCHSFGLPSRPDELKLVKAQLVRTLLTHGTLAIGLEYLLFWRRAVGRDLKVKVPLNDIQGVDTYHSILWHHYGLVIHITAHSDMFFDFHTKDNRDMVLATLKRVIEAKEKHKRDADSQSIARSITTATDDSHATKVDPTSPTASIGPEAAKTDAKAALFHASETEVPVFEPDMLAYLPKMVNVDSKLIRNSLRISPMRIYCLTIGSRGDVQPYIALCKALKQHGHTPVIVSHPEYRGWVEGHGIEYRGVGGDPAALMKLSVEHRIFSPAFFRESIGKFRVWLDELLRECWEECQGADLLIESPPTMAGIHVAEGLGIPYFRAFTMPWTKTSAYPQAFSVPAIEMGPSYNSSSYALFDQILWVATSGQINRWRKHMVGIGPTDWSKLDTDAVPFIYNFSPAVVPMPNDWGDRVKISGYWFLDNPDNDWKPPPELAEFLARAKKDGKKIAYIGFGSITIENAEEVSANIMKAVRQADVRAIVAKGWSGRGGSKKKKKPNKHAPQAPQQYDESAHADSEHEHEHESEAEIEIPDDVFVVDSIPHDWLFPQIDIAMHHGGAGTTGASLRAGLVTLIKPFFGDQFFWANRVQKLGAGARVNGLGVNDFTDALKAAALDRVMVEKAQGVGEKIRTEDGVATAIEFLYKNIPLANRRTQRKLEREATHSTSPAGTPGSSVFANPLARFSSHGRQSSGSSRSELLSCGRKEPHRAATLPTSAEESDGAGAVPHRASTIVESPAQESEASTPPAKSGTSSASILPSLSSLQSLPASMASTLKEMVTLQSSTSDTTADGDQAGQGGVPTRSQTTPVRTPSADENEEQRLARLKGYKNAKAEDQRRRKLLLERLEREKRAKEQGGHAQNASTQSKEASEATQAT